MSLLLTILSEVLVGLIMEVGAKKLAKKRGRSWH